MSKDLEIKVSLNTGDFQKGIEQNRAAIKSLDKERANIIIDLKKEQLEADFRKIKEDLSAIGGSQIRPITFEVDRQKIDTSIADVRKRLSDLASQKTTAEIKLQTDKAQAEAAITEVKQRLADLSAQKVTPEIRIQKEQARAELQQLQESLKALKSTKIDPQIDVEIGNSQAELNKLQTELNRLDATKTQAEIDIEQDKALTDLAKIRGEISQLDQTKIDINVDIDKSKIANAIAEIKTGISREIGAKLAEGLAAIPIEITKTTLEFEKLKTALKTTLGSQSEADKAFAFIQEFAEATPFQVSAITDSFVKLQNRGIAPTRELLTQLGDLASSNNKTLDQVVEAILDATTGENERLKEFGITASKAGDQVTFAFKGVEKTVANTPEAIKEAIASFGSFQGVAGGMEAQSKTLGGQLSNLQDKAAKISLAFGEELTPILLDIVKGFVDSAGSAEDFAKGAGQNVGNAIKFLVDNADKLKIVLELVVVQFALTKAQAAGAAISTLASGASALTASGGFAALAASAGAAALSIAAVVAPLALAYAGFKAIETIRSTKDMEELSVALDQTAKTAQTTGNETFKLASKLQALGEARKAGTGDPAKEKGYLDIANKQVEALEKLKQEQLAIANVAGNEEKKNAAKNLAKDYEIQANALKGQISNLQKINTAKDDGAKKTKEEIKAAQDLAKEEQKIAKAKLDIDRNASAKKADLLRGNEQKSQEKGIETKRDTALDNLKIKQAKEIGEFQDRLENSFNEKKLKGEKAIADFKESREAAIEKQKTDAEATRAKIAEDFQQARQSDADKFRQDQEAADARYQKQKQENERKFNESLSGAKSLIDREAQLGTADPKEAAKLQQKFAEEDRIKAAVASTNVDTNATKEQFAQQAKQIAGVSQIGSQEDAAKVQLALAELEAKAKAQFAEQERAKDAEYNAKKQAEQAVFQQTQRDLETGFKEAQKADALNFETNVLKPQRDALEAEVNAKKIEFEQGTLKPLKLAQEAELAAFKQGKETETNALKLQFENELEAVRTAAKLREIDLDAQAQKQKLDTEAAFKDQQRALDLQNATQVAAILSTAKLQKANLLGAVGIAAPTNIQGGLKNSGNNIQKLTSGVNAATTKNTNNTTNQNGVSIGNLTVQTPDPMKDMTKVLREIANLEAR